MTDNRQFKFKQGVGSSAFSKTLSKRIEAYFKERNISQYANREMVFKTVLAIALWIVTYLWLVFGQLSSLGVIGAYAVHGFAQLFMGLNIGHDANHGAYSTDKRVNRALGRVFDLVGMSSYMWRLMHNHSHHPFVNVQGADTALEIGTVLRYSPHEKRLPFHRYQHLYAPLLYCLSTLDWVFVKDYRFLFFPRFGNVKIAKHPASEVMLLLVGKLFYYGYTLVVPLLYLEVPWYAVILGFTVMHVLLGASLAITFQPNHFTGDSAFPDPADGPQLPSNHIKHIFDTTVDYARGNPLANWSLGGLNLHVVHHMFPRICHVHYPALTEIIKTTAEEHGLTYRENRTIAGAFWAHLRWLKILGGADTVLATPRPGRGS